MRPAMRFQSVTGAAPEPGQADRLRRKRRRTNVTAATPLTSSDSPMGSGIAEATALVTFPPYHAVVAV
ncbi:MAG TPA: hypothetical protein VIZ17_15250, partial [Acetobacteraceae bacterium]